MTPNEQYWISTAAILISPILAVQVERALQGMRENRRRRENVFHTLMATRATRVAPEHVIALNRIDIEWFGTKILGIHRRSRMENEVLAAWKLYLDHLNTKPDTVGGLDVWGAKGDELFTDLLYVMSKSLGYDFDKVTLKRGAYSPVAHGTMEQEQNEMRKMFVEWLKGARPVRVELGSSGASPAPRRPTDLSTST